MSNPVTRQSLDNQIQSGALAEAFADLQLLFAEAPTLANAGTVLATLPKLSHLARSIKARVAIVRSFTVEPAVPLLRAGAGLIGLDLEIRVGEFNTFARDLLDPTGFLAEFEPAIVFVAAQTCDFLPDIWRRGAEIAQGDVMSMCDERLAEMRGYLVSYRSRSAADIVVQNFEQPLRPSSGILDAQLRGSQGRAIERLNAGLRELAAEIPGVYVMDYDGLVARAGRLRWRDEQKWLTARMPISAQCLPLLAQEYLRFAAPLCGRTAKVVVCDLDNTLWGGVIGEDGITGIRLGAEYPGAAHLALQQALLDLSSRGILLAIASKNNASDALQALEQHPGMLLAPRHFSAIRINWNDKAQSIREIAGELNIGIDAVAFLDDNPVERRRVRLELPQVHVLELPSDPMQYAAALRDCPLFERVAVSSEDMERGRFYAEQRERTTLQGSADSLEDFYRSLEQVVVIGPVDAANVTRVAQLTQKTNQFNLTTRRYSEAQIASMAADPAVHVYAVSVRDRFGDNGIVAVAILRRLGSDCEVDTFLMSCRVIGRTVETAIMAELVRTLRGKGVATVWGWFLPTAKNTPAARFYEEHGFTQFSPAAESEAPGAAAWCLDSHASAPAVPEWITIENTSAT